jgi:hypothetical protein
LILKENLKNPLQCEIIVNSNIKSILICVISPGHKPSGRTARLRDQTIRNHYLANHKAQIMNFIQTTERQYKPLISGRQRFPSEHMNIISNGKAGDPHGKPV